MEVESNIVKISNGLVRAVQRLSLAEKRLLMLAVSKIDKGAGIDQIVIVTGAEYSEFYSVQRSPAYKALKAGKEKLQNRELMVPEIAGRMTIRWIISYDYDNGSALLRFHPDLDGHVVNLKERFTRYLLTRAADFKHLYTWRLFELILQFRTTGVLKIKVDDFKRIMETPAAYDKDFGLIRSKVINPSLKEIKEKDGLKITFTVKKEGRTITGLEFTFPTEQQIAAPLPIPKQTPKKPAPKPALTAEQIAKREAAAEAAHLKKMAELSGLSVDEIAPKKVSTV